MYCDSVQIHPDVRTRAYFLHSSGKGKISLNSATGAAFLIVPSLVPILLIIKWTIYCTVGPMIVTRIGFDDR